MVAGTHCYIDVSIEPESFALCLHDARDSRIMLTSDFLMLFDDVLITNPCLVSIAYHAH